MKVVLSLFFVWMLLQFATGMEQMKNEELTGQYEELEWTLNELGEQLANEGERKQAANARVQELEVEVMSVGNSLRSMESGNAEIDALEKKYQQATSKASASEYRSDELEENVNGKENELSASKVKYEDAKTELDSLYAEIYGMESEGSGDEEIELQNIEINKKLAMAKRKNVVLTRDIERTRAKADSLEKRAEVMEETISHATETLQVLKETEGSGSSKETCIAEQKLLLEGQRKAVQIRSEVAERNVAALERALRELETEIESWNKKENEVVNEMNEILGDSPPDMVADDDDEDDDFVEDNVGELSVGTSNSLLLNLLLVVFLVLAFYVGYVYGTKTQKQSWLLKEDEIQLSNL